jgi:hypothetical protein
VYWGLAEVGGGLSHVASAQYCSAHPDPLMR